jgi:hypothetical protein
MRGVRILDFAKDRELSCYTDRINACWISVVDLRICDEMMVVAGNRLP